VRSIRHNRAPLATSKRPRIGGDCAGTRNDRSEGLAAVELMGAAVAARDSGSAGFVFAQAETQASHNHADRRACTDRRLLSRVLAMTGSLNELEWRRQ
jgi:hypothetical protein